MPGMFFGRGIFEILFMIAFCLIACTMILMLVKVVKGIGEWNKNNHSPRLEVSAVIVGKRTRVSHDLSHNHGCSTYTSYYVTFQVESGDRMEFHVSGSRYGLMAEGDKGRLFFQGSRFLEFEREQ